MFQEPENNPKILVVSDVHIGALKSNLQSFRQFLTNINNGKYGNDLQALLILGDCFDLCTDTPQSLLENEETKNIFDLLLEVKGKISLFFILGNHEIPVTDSIFSGSYEEKFEQRKEKFIENFKNTKYREMFHEKCFSQYAVLRKWNGRDKILFFNSRDQIYDRYNFEKRIQGLNLPVEYVCLMAHGYQFDSDLFRFFAGMTWKSIIKSEEQGIKELFDFFWNEIVKAEQDPEELIKVKEVDFDQIKTRLPELKSVTPDELNENFSEIGSVEFMSFKLFMRMLEQLQKKRKEEYYIKGIKRFLSDKEHDFSKITHVIYGHSHLSKNRDDIELNGRKLIIVNDGAWQHVPPTFLKISAEGYISMESMTELVITPPES